MAVAAVAHPRTRPCLRPSRAAALQHPCACWHFTRRYATNTRTQTLNHKDPNPTRLHLLRAGIPPTCLPKIKA